jgi:soluble lytic murein transglycosylase-like protein
VLQYLGLVLGAAKEVGVDPAAIAALMEVEGSGEDAISPAGAAGLMQLLPDKFLETDDPFDPGTNLLRAAQHIRRLIAAYDGDLAAVAAAYFGAVDSEGRVTDDSDGNLTGIEYVTAFAEAYERWALAFDRPLQVIVIRPVIRQRRPTPGPDGDQAGLVDDGPLRDQWYLQIERPQPAMPPIFS